MAKSDKSLTVIGLMSGTSVDSIDAACIRVAFEDNKPVIAQFELLDTHTLDIPDALRAKLLKVMGDGEASLETLCRLNMTMGEQFGKAAKELIEKLKAKKITVDVVASHGQTIWHIPPKEGELGATMQIGEPAVIAEITGCEVAADFRPGDIAAGGQGAPLVPFADKLLFQDKKVGRAVQNIGGIANLTAMTALDVEKAEFIAFDTGPGNMIMDGLMTALFQKPYDKNGDTAASGELNHPMLISMRDNAYFHKSPPKSTGRELFGNVYVQGLLKSWSDTVAAADMVTTATHFTAITIVEAYQQFVLPKIDVKEVVVGGGGVENAYLMGLLTESFAALGITVKRHEDLGISSKYKEAIAFALLGAARKLGIPSNITACTGAKHPVVLGARWAAEG